MEDGDIVLDVDEVLLSGCAGSNPVDIFLVSRQQPGKSHHVAMRPAKSTPRQKTFGVPVQNQQPCTKPTALYKTV